jgi:hypothetical protein
MRDGDVWHVEARAALPDEEDRYVWLPFAHLQCTGSDNGKGSILSFVPQEDERANSAPERTAAKEQIREACKKIAAAEAESQQGLADALGPLVVALEPGVCPTPDKRPLGHLALELLGASQWLENQREFLLRIQPNELDGLLNGLAELFCAGLRRVGEKTGRTGLSLEGFIESAYGLFAFISRILKLHWYMGHGKWKDVLSHLDGGFPRTPRPSAGWYLPLMPDLPIGQALSDYESLACVLARSWLWPWCYHAATELNEEYDRAVWWETRQRNLKEFATLLGDLGDWWLAAALPPHAYQPILVRRSALAELLADPKADSDALVHLVERCDHLDADAPFTDYWTRVDEYRERIANPESYVPDHASAFPAEREDLSIQDLFARDRLGFAVREFETEIEGDDAWRRCVYNAVFEDAYGPQALGMHILRKATRLHYAAARPHPPAAAFLEGSHVVELLLQQFIGEALERWHGDAWRMAVPERVLNKAQERAKKDGIPEPRRPKELLHQADLIDCKAILLDKGNDDERNWGQFTRYLEATGSERPSKKHALSDIAKWSDKRNAAAHPAKCVTITWEDLEILRPIRSRILRWSSLLNVFHPRSKSDDG